jgi:oligopeptide transport system permease protein
VSRHVLRRLLVSLPTLLLIVTLSFYMMRLAPGGPFDQERPIPPEIRANIERAYHLDEPLWQQYLRYLGGVARGDFGPSYRTKDFTVTELLLEGAPASFKVGGLAVVLATVLGLLAGMTAALRQNSWVDYTSMGLAMVGIAIPNFVMAPLLTLVFGVYLGWLPVGGWGGGAWPFLVLPVVSLALPQVARVARLSRGAMIEQLHANYVRTARARACASGSCCCATPCRARCSRSCPISGR